ncbi:butyrophilin subfamily 1 member A1 [Microcaecilia unicolor]|uniref:Butyrophilin subfamily 1 member A1-like n=1 Tax=Microcaecilia unicolor TaxID=1415580 RepID=A0A6P7XJJ3_9AMPH|nr:butyrophilin subfamily 1 member A1-like [Microcaecilia unicolor]
MENGRCSEDLHDDCNFQKDFAVKTEHKRLHVFIITEVLNMYFSCTTLAKSPVPAFILFLISHHLQIANTAGTFKVIGPEQPVIALLGEDAVLSCRLSPGLSAEHMQVRWFRTGFDSIVHLYENRLDQNKHQILEYKGRTELIIDHISSGNVSLRIQNIRPYDDGRYTCFFLFDNYYDEAALELKVGVVGTAPSFSLNVYQDSGMRVVCEATGWYPEPEVTWKQDDGQSLTSLSETETQEHNGLFNVKSNLILITNRYSKFSCHIRNSILNQERESAILISDAFFQPVSRWVVILSIILMSVMILYGLLVVLPVSHLRKSSKEKAKLSADIESLSAELEWRRSRTYAVDVTLDPETAHPDLMVSKDQKSVTSEDPNQDVPDNLQRFDSFLCVLGCECFTSGKHYWEVEVKNKTEWALGVCKDSVKRKGVITPSPRNGYWVLWLLHEGNNWAFSSHTSELTSIERPKSVGILLDYEGGKVSFYNAEEKCHLFTFTDNFEEKLRPFFYPGLFDDTNSGALKIQGTSAWE